MKTNPFLTYHAIATIGLLFLTSASATQSASPDDVTIELETVVGFFVRDGGRWLAKNPSYEPGLGVPKFYGYEYRWALENTLVQNTIHAIYEDGSRHNVAETIFRWNPILDAVEQHLFIRGGGTGYGIEYRNNDDVYEAKFSVSKGLHTPKITQKDRVKITGPDSFDNATYEMQPSGEWLLNPGSEVEFTRLKP